MSDSQSVILLDNNVKSWKDQVSLEQICAFNKTILKVFFIEQMGKPSLRNEPNFSALGHFNLYFSMHRLSKDQCIKIIHNYSAMPLNVSL